MELTQDLLDDLILPYVSYLNERFIDMKLFPDETIKLTRKDNSFIIITLEEYGNNGSITIQLDPRLEYSMNRLRIGFKPGMEKYRDLRPVIIETDEDFYENSWSGYSRENYVPYSEYINKNKF